MNRILRFTTATLSILCLATLCTEVEAGLGDDIRLSGYGNIHYMNMDGNPEFYGGVDVDTGVLQLREFSLYLDAPVSEKVVISLEIEAGDNGNSFTANYAYVSIDVTETLNLRVGRYLIPFLSYNENKPNFRQHLMSAPFTAFITSPVIGAPIRFQGFGWSDVGAMATWMRPLGNSIIGDLKFAVFNGIGSERGILDANSLTLNVPPMEVMGEKLFATIRPRDGFIQNSGVPLWDVNNDKSFVVKGTLRSLATPLEMGASVYQGKWDPDGKQNLIMYGGNASWVHHNWGLRGEFARAEVEQEAGQSGVEGAMPMAAKLSESTGDYTMQSWYVEASAVPLRYTQNRYLRVVARLDGTNPNDKAAFTPWNRTRVTLGSEWEFAENVRLRYEWQRSTLTDFDKSPGPFRESGGQENVRLNMLSLIFHF